jgi:energy-coupling factor transport system permease protein
MLDPRASLIWALTVLAVASSTRNPLYVVLMLLCAMVVERAPTPGRRHPTRGSPASLRFALVAIPLAALFSALTVRFGDTVVLTLPDWLPVLGGPVTAEALVSGAINGLTLTAIFTAFSAFNRATAARDLVRLAPRAFHETGVVISIALTFIPQTSRSLRRIREAQAVRGHRVRRLRDWLPIFVPLLISGLERAMGLAEAMVARGYGATSERRHSAGTQAALVLGLLLVLAGWLAYLFFPAWRALALAALLSGAAVTIALIWLLGRAVPHTTLHERRLTWRDGLALAGCALALAAFLAPLPLAGKESLAYAAYPRVSLPGFDPLIGLATLGLAAPGLAMLLGGAAHD